MTKATPMTKAIQKTHSLLTCLEKHEYGTPIESNHYQKDLINLELQGPNDNQATANYTQHITENSSSRKMYTRIQLIKYHHQKKNCGESTFRKPKKLKTFLFFRSRNRFFNRLSCRIKRYQHPFME